MSTERSRQAAGQRTGGQFKAEQHTEGDLELNPDDEVFDRADEGLVDSYVAVLGSLDGAGDLPAQVEASEEILDQDGWSYDSDLTQVAVDVADRHGGNPAVLRDALLSRHVGLDLRASKEVEGKAVNDLVRSGVNHAEVIPSSVSDLALRDSVMGTVEMNHHADGTFDVLAENYDTGEMVVSATKVSGVTLLDALDKRQDAMLLERLTGKSYDTFEAVEGPILDAETGVLTVPSGRWHHGALVRVSEYSVDPVEGEMPFMSHEEADRLVDLRRALMLSDTRNPARALIARDEFADHGRFHSAAQAQAARGQVLALARENRQFASWREDGVAFSGPESQVVGVIRDNGVADFGHAVDVDRVESVAPLVEKVIDFEHRASAGTGIKVGNLYRKEDESSDTVMRRQVGRFRIDPIVRD